MAKPLPIGGRWRAQVRVKGRKSIARTFDTYKEAESWERRTRLALEGSSGEDPEATVARVVAVYREMHETAGKPIAPASNTHYMLLHLTEDMGTSRLTELTPKAVAAWAKLRRDQGAGPGTVNQELSLLGTVIRFAASAMNCQLPDVVGQARPMLRLLELIGSHGRRGRRAEGDELVRVVEWLAQKKGRHYADFVSVSAICGIRRSELAGIKWADVDEKARAVWVRNRKHPRQLSRHDDLVPLFGDAWPIVQAQRGRDPERIFPINPATISRYFLEATRALGIPDLRLHDMRREAGSALHDLGFTKEQRKAVLGHRSDSVHDRYIVVRPQQLHEQFAAGTQDKKQRPPHPRKGRARQT